MKNLQKMIDDKYISVQKHPTEDLFIYNYTQKAQFDKVWTEETMMCRGLILDKNKNIVARPFKKFFNLGEIKDLPVEEFTVQEKFDGSLGILYWIKDEPYLATRGSFTSDQAKVGTEILQQYRMYFEELNRNYTYLFEIIYPENRIVVDYKGMKNIILLAVIDIETGEEKDLYKECSGFGFAGYINGITDYKTLALKNKENKEGFVIKFKSGLRVKIKFDEYVRLHRLVTGLNARHIWENLKEGKGITELIDHVPDEFYKWVKDTSERISSEYVGWVNASVKVFEAALKLPTRKEQAELVKDFNCRSIVFAMLDGKDYSPIIWKMIKPKHEVPFKKEI